MALIGGAKFPMQLDQAIAGCSVGLVIIGESWESCAENDAPRLFSDGDYVRAEVLGLLSSGKVVIPVLIGRGQMPNRAHVPEELAPLLGAEPRR